MTQRWSHRSMAGRGAGVFVADVVEVAVLVGGAARLGPSPGSRTGGTP